jgi:hypothetical protein
MAGLELCGSVRFWDAIHAVWMTEMGAKRNGLAINAIHCFSGRSGLQAEGPGMSGLEQPFGIHSPGYPQRLGAEQSTPGDESSPCRCSTQEEPAVVHHGID